MGKVLMYLTIILTIGVLAPLFGIETTSLMIWDTIGDIVQSPTDFIINSFINNPFWTTLVTLLTLTFGIGSIFIGTTFKIPLELIALIPLTVLLIPLTGDLLAINTVFTEVCSGTGQFGCFMQPIVFLLSAILYVGYIFSLISWWAGRNA